MTYYGTCYEAGIMPNEKCRQEPIVVSKRLIVTGTDLIRWAEASFSKETCKWQSCTRGIIYARSWTMNMFGALNPRRDTEYESRFWRPSK